MTVTRAPGVADLTRFHIAQDRGGVYRRALAEIRAGRKETHWMWFVFPQLRALARSEMARRFGIATKDEALAYLDDPILRVRLAESTMGVLSHKALFFSDTDRRKLQACMTLFSKVTSDPTLAKAVLDKFYGGQEHQLTLDVLAGKRIVLPPSRPATAMGRVELGHHWEKQVAAARAAVARTGQLPDRTEPMLRDEIEKYLRGFGLSPRQVRLISHEWRTDAELARDQGYHDGVEEAESYSNRA